MLHVQKHVDVHVTFLYSKQIFVSLLLMFAVTLGATVVHNHGVNSTGLSYI